MKKPKFVLSALVLILICPMNFAWSQSPADTLNLQSIVFAALEHNRSLKNEVLEIEKSREIRKGIHHAYVPTLELGGEYAYSTGRLNLETRSIPVNVPGISLPPVIPGFPPLEIPPNGIDIPPVDHEIDYSGNLWLGGLTAKWTLFTGLRAPYLSKAMRHKIKALEQSYVQAEAELISEVCRYYDKIALLDQTGKVLEVQRERLVKETQVARKALEQGLITRHEFQKTDIFRLELESKQIEYEGSKELLMLKLNQLTGIPIEDLKRIEVDLSPRMNEHTEKSYLDRPEILALDEAEQALENKFKSEVSGYLPKVQAFATHQYAGFTNGELGVIAFNEISAYPINALGIGMKWELFDGLHTRNERIKARIELEQAQNKKEEVRQLLELNYRNSMSKFKTLTAQTALKKEQLKSSQESMDISYKEYKNGLIQLSDFLEAQARFTTSVLDYYETLCSQRDTSLELLKATGSLKIKYL